MKSLRMFPTKLDAQGPDQPPPLHSVMCVSFPGKASCTGPWAETDPP